MNRREKMTSAVAGVALLALVTIVGWQWTLASWVSREYAAGTFAAKTIPPPVISSCTLLPGPSGASPVVTIVWNFPSGNGYVNPANIQYFRASGGLLAGLTPVGSSTVTTTGPVGVNYTTVFGSALLAGLLGSSYLVGLRDFENGWTSTLTSSTAAMGPLGINATCLQNP